MATRSCTRAPTDIAEFVFNDSKFKAVVRRLEDVIHQRGLSCSEEASQDSDRDLCAGFAFCHLLVIMRNPNMNVRCVLCVAVWAEYPFFYLLLSLQSIKNLEYTIQYEIKICRETGRIEV